MKRELPYGEYLSYTKDKKSLFYKKNNNNLLNITGKYVLPTHDKEKWHVNISKHWTYVINRNKDFPNQGWKIHLSTITSESQLLLSKVATYLMLHDTSFKYVSNTNEWLLKNAKYGNRAASGKFITVYPTDESDFENLLNELENITKDFRLGPYILNDKQWHNSNVYFRYGGLKKIESEIDGVTEDVIFNDKGEAIKDQRVPYYFVPDFIEEPKFIKANNYSEVDESTSELDKFQDISAIHFSNGGGVYNAVINNKKMVLKEGRSEAGIDKHNRDGFERNHMEYITLLQLREIKEVVNANNYFIIWRHNYFTEEFVDGKTIKEYIATKFPFYKQNSQDLSKYIDESIFILQQIKNTLEKIHEKGIAVGDLSLNNIIIQPNGHIKFIDFESSQLVNEKFMADIVTPEFYSTEAKTFGENDWYAFYKIAYYLFLPISSLSNIAPNIIYVHDDAIKRKFGIKVVNFLTDIRKFVGKRTNLFPKSEFIENQFNVPFKKLDIQNTNFYKYQVINGIINNVNPKTHNLILGDIRQNNSYLGNYNISNGGYGVLLILKRAGYNIQENADIKAWINQNLPYITSVNYTSTDFGLFSGLTGISGALFELGYSTEAHDLFLQIANTPIEDINDISLYSGLAGIGLAQIHAYLNFGDIQLLNQSTNISRKLLEKFKKDATSTSDYGLLTGWSGVLLFLWEYGKIMSNNQYKQNVIDCLKDIQPYLLKDGKTSAMQVVNRFKNKERVVPYLENGAAGLVLLLLEIKKDSDGQMDTILEEMLIHLQESARVFSAYNAGLFDGYLSQLLMGIAQYSVMQDEEVLKESLLGLNNYLIKNNDSILLPGRFGYKFSSDLETGSAGLLALLNDIQTNKWNTWLPIIFSSNNLFSN